MASPQRGMSRMLRFFVVVFLFSACAGRCQDDDQKSEEVESDRDYSVFFEDLEPFKEKYKSEIVRRLKNKVVSTEVLEGGEGWLCYLGFSATEKSREKIGRLISSLEVPFVLRSVSMGWSRQDTFEVCIDKEVYLDAIGLLVAAVEKGLVDYDVV